MNPNNQFDTTQLAEAIQQTDDNNLKNLMIQVAIDHFKATYSPCPPSSYRPDRIIIGLFAYDV